MLFFPSSEEDLCERAAGSIRETGGADLAGLKLEVQVAEREVALRKIKITGSTFREGK